MTKLEASGSINSSNIHKIKTSTSVDKFPRYIRFQEFFIFLSNPELSAFAGRGDPQPWNLPCLATASSWDGSHSRAEMDQGGLGRAHIWYRCNTIIYKITHASGSEFAVAQIVRLRFRLEFKFKPRSEFFFFSCCCCLFVLFCFAVWLLSF